MPNNKQISDLPRISANNFDKNSDCILAQLNGDYPTFLAAVQNATEVAQNSGSLTMLNQQKHVADIAAVGQARRDRNSYDLSSYGVPSTANAAYIRLQQSGQAYPRLWFYYYKNAIQPNGHYFEYYYDRAQETDFYLWVPVDDAKIYIEWVWVKHGNQYTKMYLRGFS